MPPEDTMDWDADRVAGSNTPKTVRRRDYDRTNSDPYSDEEISLIRECRERNRERELLSRREAIRDAKQIIVGGIATVIAIKGLLDFSKAHGEASRKAYWDERPFHDSGEIMTLEWGETWLNKMYIPVAKKYKGISPDDVEYASKQLNKDYDEKGIDANGKPCKTSLDTDIAGTSKHVPAFDVELADNSDRS